MLPNPHGYPRVTTPQNKDKLTLWVLWHYELWSFQTWGTKLEKILPKNQHTQRKLLNFKD